MSDDTSIQEEIPDDVREAARELLTSALTCARAKSAEQAIEMIAAALLAERRRQIERDAEICEAMTWHKKISPAHVRANGPEDFASAIRAQLEGDEHRGGRYGRTTRR